MLTPWGKSDTEYGTRYGPDGLVFYVTPSHGGFYVPPGLRARMPAELAAIKSPYTREAGWYEEDVDWAIVALAFPDAFPLSSLFGAVETVESYPDDYEPMVACKRYLATPEGAKVKAAADAYRTANAHKFRRGMEGTARAGWRIDATRLDGAERVVLEFPSVPRLDPHFTIEEAERLGGRLLKRETLTTRS